MISGPIIERLEALLATIGAKTVAGVFDLMSALDAIKASPSLFVVRTGDGAGQNTAATSIVAQSAEIRFDVIAAFNRATLGGTRDLLDHVQEGIVAALLGWSHPASDAATEFRGAGMARLDFDAGLLFWRVSFAFPRLIQG